MMLNQITKHRDPTKIKGKYSSQIYKKNKTMPQFNVWAMTYDICQMSYLVRDISKKYMSNNVVANTQ